MIAQIHRHPAHSTYTKLYVKFAKSIDPLLHTDPKQSKKFVRGFVTGGGETHVQNFRRAGGYLGGAVGEFVSEFRAEQAHIRELDCLANPALLAKIRDSGEYNYPAAVLELVTNEMHECDVTHGVMALIMKFHGRLK